MRIRTWIFSAGWLLWALTAQAQHWKFQMYGADQGLTNATILALHQDHDGFIWVSTEAGLFRYDGDRFEQFKSDPVATRGDTRTLYSSADGQFWVGTSLGVFRWSGERFVAVPGFEGVELEGGETISGDAANLYVATPAGLRSLPLRGGGPARLLSKKWSYSVYVASDQTIWYGCGSAVCSLRDGREHEWAVADGVPVGRWTSVAEDAARHLWVRSDDKVLRRDSAGAPFLAPPGLEMLGSSNHAALAPTRRGPMLLPNDAGLMACEGRDCRNYGVESGLRHTGVISALEDREGSIWLGYSGSGVARWLGRDEWQGFAEEEGLADPGIWRIVRDAHGGLWVGTTHGLFQGIRAGDGWRFRRSAAADDLTVYGLTADPDGSLWVGTFQNTIHGILHYDPQTGKKVIYTTSKPLPPFAVYDIVRDSSGTIWVGMPRGVLRLAPGAEKLEPVDIPLDLAGVHDIKISGNTLYMATKKGLYIQQGSTRRLLTKANGLKDNRVQSVEIGPDGAVWIDYFSSSGISRIDFTGGNARLRHFTVDDGLPSNVVYSQFFDARQRHWLATDNGVAVEEGDHWTHYDTSDGLIWNDCNAHAYMVDDDGTVWIGTSAGVARFHPVEQPEPVVPATLITSVLRNDVVTGQTDFGPAMHSLGLRFTMLSYRHNNPTFRYRLGTDTNPWIETQAREVRFAELPAGSYRFEVQGEVKPGVWGHPAVLEFRIRGPWFLSWPCRISVVFLLAGITWLWWRRREAGQRKVRADLEVAVEERTRDLTAARARAEQASRVKSEFVANISHEMRTPLNAVIGFTHLALQLAEQEELSEYLKNVHLSAKGLLDLINDVLDFSKMEAGRVAIVPVTFAPRPFVSAIASMLNREALRKGLELKMVVEDSAPQWVSADEGRLRQVLVNLLGNAIKFTSRGSVTLQVSYSANQLKFAVSDTGIGIPREKQKAVFEAFQQADNSTSRRYGGTGLGLTISKKLVESMGGQLLLTSEPDRGSTFSFHADAPEASAPAPVRQRLEEAAARPMKILVAEDNRVNQRLIVALLEKRGHSTAVAGNGVEALAAIERESFDMVLMDIQMPEMDGLEAVRRIREAESDKELHLPVVAMTARAMAGDREAILATGMDDYLEKPVQIDRLDAILRHASGMRQPDPGARPIMGRPDRRGDLRV